MLKNLRDYANAIWSDLAARMSGIASLAFTTWQVYSDAFSGKQGAAYARWYWWLAAALCFLFANYRVWIDERKKRISETPRFELFPEHVDWEYAPIANETTFVVALSLANVGAPSATRRWKGFLNVGIAREQLQTINLTERWFLGDPAGKNPIMLLPKDQIIFKTQEGSIATGNAVNGRIFFVAAGDKRALMSSMNWSLQVTCEDCFNNTFMGTLVPELSAVTERKCYPGEQPIPAEVKEELRLMEEKNGKQSIRRARSTKEVRGRNEKTLPGPKA